MVQVASALEISYPIAELGDCGSQEECKTFCDEPRNAENCQLWAENKGLVPKHGPANPSEGGGEPKDPIDGPGGCKSPQECDAFCRIEENLQTCMDYSVKNGFMSQEEADKILAQAKRGGPGGCKGEEECDSFCKKKENARECMKFVVDEGVLTQEEADFMAEQMEQGGGPGGKPKGGGPAEPKIDEGKIQEILSQKTGPGGCKDMQECSDFCMGGEHMEECMKFAEENGLMAPEEMEKAKKMSTMGGPGGCKGEKECDEFCGQEENRDTCFNFAKDNGLLSPEEVQMMERQMSIIKKLDSQRGSGGPGGSGRPGGPMGGPDGPMGPGGPDEMMPPQGGPQDGQQQGGIRNFFGNFFGGQEQPERGNVTDGAEINAPVACTSPEECQRFCESNPDACKNYQSPQMPSNESTPGPMEWEEPGDFQGGPAGNFTPPEGFNMPQGFSMPQGFRPPEGMMQGGQNMMPFGEGGGGMGAPGDYDSGMGMGAGDSSGGGMMPEQQSMMQQMQQSAQQQVDRIQQMAPPSGGGGGEMMGPPSGGSGGGGPMPAPQPSSFNPIKSLASIIISIADFLLLNE